MGKHRWPIASDTRAPTGPALRLHSGDAGGTDGLRSRRLSGRAPAAGDEIRVDDDGNGWIDDVLDDDPLGNDGDFDEYGDSDDSNGLLSRQGPPVQSGIRWGVARSAALVFLGVALAVGAALFLVRSSEPSAAAVSVQLDAATSADAEPSAVPETGPPADSPSDTDPVDGSKAAAGAETGADSGGGTRAGTIVVYVTGAVNSPGVVTAASGTRLFEILEQVGGALPEADLEGINLAGLPADGEHLHVLAVGEEPRPVAESPAVGSTKVPVTGEGTPPGDSAGASSEGIIDINTATLAEVETLPRVGPVLGQRIIEWRDTNGPFARPADLDAVPGIGPALLEGILPLIAVR